MAHFHELYTQRKSIIINFDLVEKIVSEGEGCRIYFQGDDQGTFVLESQQAVYTAWKTSRD